MTSHIQAFCDAAGIEKHEEFHFRRERYLFGNLSRLVEKLANCVKAHDIHTHLHVSLTHADSRDSESPVNGLIIKSEVDQRIILQLKIDPHLDSKHDRDGDHVFIDLAEDGKKFDKANPFYRLEKDPTDYPETPPENAHLPDDVVHKLFEVFGAKLGPLIHPEKKPRAHSEPIRTRTEPAKLSSAAIPVVV